MWKSPESIALSRQAYERILFELLGREFRYFDTSPGSLCCRASLYDIHSYIVWLQISVWAPPLQETHSISAHHVELHRKEVAVGNVDGASHYGPKLQQVFAKNMTEASAKLERDTQILSTLAKTSKTLICYFMASTRLLHRMTKGKIDKHWF